ncbi:sialidase family protein [Adhaeribacter rhizoryzae]|uniref:exo-alpha-sialidase n=1 Tax=Adhaeribacter rhizoryzae TaxID=2607907 RepID=A0A5M6DGE2_9BACT|nr:sialidase family protein [Adhaeribacter rhizoryzae]KAA5546627.1 exo-alpha-sialidase [Adhaeribacter rhizoryzae]
MKRIFLACTLIFCALVLRAQTVVPVYISGTEGHQSYRIPAIIGLPNGHLLAFAEGRVQGAGDFGDINIVLKRSTDKGKTWSNLQTVVDYNNLQAGNPAPVVDVKDPAYPKGRIFLFYNTGNNHENEVRKGNGLREVWYKTSTDGGLSWSEPVNITTQVHRPKQPQINVAYNFSEDWRSYANTPGHAMQFASGAYKGRIFVAANHSAGNPQPQAQDYQAHCFYTDDHGKTFKLGITVQVPGSNESTATELSGGKLLMNSRNQKGDIRARIISVSSNGGTTWDSTWFDHTLIDPVNQGSLLTLGKKKGKNIIAFSNAASTKLRDNLTLRISYDEGKSWPKNILIDKSTAPNQPNFTAYSDLVNISKSEIGVLYERDNYKQIVFKKIKWKP